MSRWVSLILLAGVLLLAALLRLHAVSAYLFYPDSYQSLLVAHNLATYHQAVGPMGPGGLIYPDFFAWTRPLYPALIALGSILADPVTAARAINLAAGLGAVVMAYVMVARALGSRPAGLAGALLLAVSFNHTVWGGFVLTEALGVFMLLLGLWLLVRRRAEPSELADPHDLLTGAMLGLATMARYEYAVILLPALVYSARPVSWMRVVNIAVAYALVVAVALALARPFYGGLGGAAAELGHFWLLPGLAAGGLVLVWLFRRTRLLTVRSLARLAQWALWVFATVIIAQMLGLPWLRGVLEAPRVFFATDPLIGWLALAGFSLMLRIRRYQTTALFLLASAVLLALTYARVNIAMQRYWTHLLPLLIIPAALALTELWRRFIRFKPTPRAVAFAAMTLVFVFQAIATFNGLRYWDRGLWMHSGYEYRAAELVKPVIPADAVIIASTPEPYFLVSHKPTQSITNDPPFIYLDDLPDDQTVAIVQDAGMEFYFPNFSRMLDRYMGELIIYQSQVGEPWRAGAEIRPERQSLRVYITKLKTLKALTNSSI